MSAFGTLTLLIALVVATYSGVASVVGARRANRRLIESGRAGVYALAAILGLSSVALLYAFLTHDYSIKYVHHYSDASSPLFYQITAYWGGLDGSILWWVFLLSVFSAVAVYSNRDRHRELLPYVVAVLMAIADFFLYVIVFHKNPFDRYLTDIPTVGKGLNPLLQNAYMVTHPPSLYTGFVGMSIPFAFGMAALISGQLDDAWIASVRKWTLGAWFFLSMGLTLGMLWAYEELGWGGFWGWDPVENAGFLPWLTATAFLHSIMIQERRGMMKIWNVTLIILTFFLTIFGTFMTRSGIVQSVHAFGQDTKLAWIFAIFMAITLIVSFGFVIKRMPELRSRATLDSWISREAAFTVNNWILLFAAFFILFATMFPTISEAVTGERITVGPPFFNKWMVPIGLVLLFLTGVGPLIAWRKATVSHLRYQFFWPSLAAVVTSAICLAAGLGEAPAGVICFGFCAFTAGTITQEFVRGVSVRKRNTGQDAVSSLMGMVIRGKRRYGGYIVHVGIVLMFIGFAGTAYKKEMDVKLVPGARRQDRQVHRPLQPPRARGRSPKGDGHRRGDGLQERQDDRPDAACEVVLPQPRERADHRGGHPARSGRGPLHHARQLRPRRRERHPQGGGEPGRRLDLVRVHAAGDRDRDRAAPRRRSRAADGRRDVAGDARSRRGGDGAAARARRGPRRLDAPAAGGRADSREVA